MEFFTILGGLMFLILCYKFGREAGKQWNKYWEQRNENS